mmetsp:Transcript_57364/g.167939  ORF Transcript_57364/g.167939 Transcript_57364/m.167939 type:complete len:247 (-) Transcript_57364:288-1028(-)
MNGVGQVLTDAHVETRHAVPQDLELVQPLRDVAPAVLLRVQVQHVHGHVLLEPLGSVLELRPGPIVRRAGLAPVAQLRVLQRLERGGGGGGHAAKAGHCLLRTGPGVLVSEVVEAAVALHHDPAEVPVESVPAVVGHLHLVREHPEADVLRDIRQLPRAQRALHLRDWRLAAADVRRHESGRGDRGGCERGGRDRCGTPRQRRRGLDHQRGQRGQDRRGGRGQARGGRRRLCCRLCGTRISCGLSG